MFFKLIADTFSIVRDSEHFIQVRSLKNPQSDDQVWISIEIIGESKYARSMVQTIVDTIEDSFFDNLNLSTYERFEQSLKEVNLIINDLEDKNKLSSKKINAIIAVFSQQDLHLTQSGDAEAYLIRGGKCSIISEGLSSKSDDLFINIASGNIASDDKMIFSTGRLLRLATHSQIIQLFSDGVAEASEGIKDILMTNETVSLGTISIHSKALQKTNTNIEKNNSKIWSYLQKASEKLIDLIPNRPKKTYNINSKKILFIILAILVVLLFSINGLVSRQRKTAMREEYKLKINTLTSEIEKANTKGYANDKESANAILDKASIDAHAILNTEYFQDEVLALLNKIEESRDAINNTDREKNLVPYVDLKSKDSNVNAIGLFGLNNNIFVYGYNKLYEVILDQALDGRIIDDTEVVFKGTAMEDQDSLIFLTQSGRVMEYVDKIFKFANTEDQTWKTGVDIASYGKNIYILNPKENQIYKYSRLRDKYSSRSNYNNNADLSNAISLAIDGNLYVLKKGGEIIRIYKSKQQAFSIEDLATDLSDVSQIYTATELDNLYLLDPVNKQVVILAKNENGDKARYYGLVVFEELNNIKSIYVNQSETKLFVLTNDAIYKIDI